MPDTNTPDNLPFPKLGQPALRALAAAGYTHLGQLANARTTDLLKLHGFGPKALPTLREALAAHNLTFADERTT
jgi:DNA-directed RNA polymerase alpha subunit